MFQSDELLLAHRPELEHYFETRSVLVYHYGEIDIIVPCFFKTDLASIPRFGRWMFKSHGRHTLAAVVHDWLYACRGEIGLPGGGKWSYTRKQADAVFLHALEASGVGGLSRHTMHKAVRLGGWAVWMRDS